MIGTLIGLLVEAEEFDPHAIVVKEDESFAGPLLAAESALVTDEVAIPITAVINADHEKVQLNLGARDVRRLPPYLSYHYRALTKLDVAREALALATATPMLPVVDQTAAKPADEIEIDAGENVMLGKTGRKLGHVKDVLYDHGELIGVVMHPEGLFKHDVLLPVRFLGRSDDLALFAHLDESDLERLPAFES